MMNRLLVLAAVAGGIAMLVGSARPAAAEDLVLCDFEAEAEVKAWSNLDVYALRETEAKAAYDEAAKKAPDPAKVAPYKPRVQPAKEPDVRIEWSAEGASSGARAMKLTYAGGVKPTVAMKPAEADWMRFKTFKATVTAPRECLVVFRVMTAKGKYGTDYNSGVSRWEFAARCVAGKNDLVTAGPAGRVLWNNITSLEIYLYNPHPGESILLDAIRLSTDAAADTTPFRDLYTNPSPKHGKPADGFKVLGADLVAKDVDDLADKLKDKRVKPEDKSAAEIEADFRAQFDKLKAAHPKAVLVTLRDGAKGCDPANPDKVFSGWTDAGTPSHLPMGLTAEIFANGGKSADIETCFRHRPGLLQVDLSSIPKGAEILAARLIVTRGEKIQIENWQTKPTMFVVEPVRREWKEYEVNVFEYAKDRFWSDYAGETWGEGGDCEAAFLACGPAAGKALTLDFTEAVKWWTSGAHENHGFILYGASKYVDYLHIVSREGAKVEDRPAVMVVYEPK